jgi:hypothetical protein
MLREHYPVDKLFEEVLGYVPDLSPEQVKIDTYLEDEKLYGLIKKDLSQRRPKTLQTGRLSRLNGERPSRRFVPSNKVRRRWQTSHPSPLVAFGALRQLVLQILTFQVFLHLAQADTVVPSVVQGYDRYAYVNNNPINATDPTGHRDCEEDDYNCDGSKSGNITGGDGNNDDNRRHNFKGLSDEELIRYFQYQGYYNSTGCGPYSIAIAANLFGDKNLLGGNIQNDLESWVWRKLPGYGMPTWSGFGQDLSRYTSGTVDQYSGASIGDLEGAILQGKLPVVAVSWQTTGQILADPLHSPVGHYMVAVGFSQNGVKFLDPGLSPDVGQQKLQFYDNQTLNHIWNETSNFAITAGTMYTISP